MFSTSFHFRILAVFCEIANRTTIDAGRRFFSTAYVNAQAVPRRFFVPQTDAFINTFLYSTRAEFLYTISLIREVIHANQYGSGMQTNIYYRQRYFSELDRPGLQPIKIVAYSETNTDENGTMCSCVRNVSCNILNVWDEYDITVDGVHNGCFTMDSVLQSTLICWYSDTCMHAFQTLMTDFFVPVTQDVSLLDAMLPTRYPPTTPIEIILNEMMIEQWNSTASYDKFYQMCHPAYCSFTYQQRSSMVFIVSTLIGLFGGLNIILRLISLIVVKIFFKFITKTNPSNPSQPWDNQAAAERE